LSVASEAFLLALVGFFSSSMSTALTMGTIMAVAAVFEIHIDRNIVGIMKPNISLKQL
jgi:hypothetical protein